MRLRRSDDALVTIAFEQLIQLCIVTHTFTVGNAYEALFATDNITFVNTRC